MRKLSFLPIVPDDAKILILGSLPGDLSLAQNQYYAHPQNRFWKVLFRLFEREYTTDYEERKKLLMENKIALWDVCQTAIRKGSMDTDIKDVVPNDIPVLLQNNPIEVVFFNGQKAAALFSQHIGQTAHISYVTLPSTSPANAQFSLDRLVEEWGKLKVKN